VLALIGTQGVEIWLYAFLYLAIGAIDSLRDAVYFSTITYGQSAMTMRQWRNNGAWFQQSKVSTES
jgi:hypothetical protein